MELDTALAMVITAVITDAITAHGTPGVDGLSCP